MYLDDILQKVSFFRLSGSSGNAVGGVISVAVLVSWKMIGARDQCIVSTFFCISIYDIYSIPLNYYTYL
jgi:hypothetical protein